MADVSSFDLAWTFFGRSKFYIFFIGMSQVIGGVLFAFRRTKLLGAAILILILANIIVIDVCFGVTPGDTFSAATYLSVVCVVLIMNREQVANVLQAMVSQRDVEHTTGNWSRRLGTGLLIAALIAAFVTTEVFMIDLLGRDNAIETRRTQLRSSE